MEALGVTLLPTLLTLNWALALAADTDCTSFRHLENGRTFFRYGGLYVAFSCNPGFRMYGHRTSSCVSGQWARHPPLCMAPGCPRPGKLLHGSSAMSPDSSLVQFTCNAGFKLVGSPLLYCNGKRWNSSTPVCKELDIMTLFQQKQTSLYKPGLEVNQDRTDPKKRFSAVAITAAKKTFLKSSLTGALHPKPHLTGGLSEESPKRPKPPNKLWHDRITTPDPLSNTLANTMQSSILVTPTKDHQEHPTKFSSLQKSENFPSSVLPLRNETSITTSQVLSASMGTNLDLIPTSAQTHTTAPRTAPAAFPEMHKNVFSSPDLSESSTHEDISQSLQVTQEENTAASTVSSLNLPVSKNTSSSPILPSRIPDKYFPWSPAAASAGNVFSPSIEMLTARPSATHTTPVAATEDLHSEHLATNNRTVTREHLEPRRLVVGQIDRELYVISKSGAMEPTGLETRSIGSHDQKNAAAKLDCTTKRDDATSAISGFPVLQTSKRRPVCPYPPLPAHGTFYFHTIPSPAPFQYKHYIQYACYAGYTLANGDVYSYCLEDGRWSGVTPACIGLTPCSMNNGGCSQACQLNAQNRMACHCRPGFLLLEDQRTCRDLDECVEGLHECQQICENTFGSYRCSCRLGFQLYSNRMSCIDVNECVLPAGQARCVFGCVNTPGSFQCLCPAGYSMKVTGGHCEDIDECVQSAGTGPCANACVNTPGSFHCVCLSGYRLAGDGTSCVPECPPGYRQKCSDPPPGNSTLLHCVDINECEEMEQMQHQHKCEWKCVNLPGTHLCICPRGYTQHGNGYQCKDINECALRNGGCSHICMNHRGGYRCACPENYRVSPHSRKKCQLAQSSQWQ